MFIVREILSGAVDEAVAASNKHATWNKGDILGTPSYWSPAVDQQVLEPTTKRLNGLLLPGEV